jgi:hypothetical protein
LFFECSASHHGLFHLLNGWLNGRSRRELEEIQLGSLPEVMELNDLCREWLCFCPQTDHFGRDRGWMTLCLSSRLFRETGIGAGKAPFQLATSSLLSRTNPDKSDRARLGAYEGVVALFLQRGWSCLGVYVDLVCTLVAGERTC